MKHGQIKHGHKSLSANHVGRVGALAVLLGVGAVFAGLPAIAAADTGADSETTVSATADGTTVSATTDAAPASPARQNRGARSGDDAPAVLRHRRAPATGGPGRRTPATR